MGEINADKCVDILCELATNEGECVYSASSDGGVPGSGYVLSVSEFGGYFWRFDDADLSGPFDDLDAAIGEGMVVTDASLSMFRKNKELYDLIQAIDVQASPGHKIEINGASFTVSKEGRLEPSDGSTLQAPLRQTGPRRYHP